MKKTPLKRKSKTVVAQSKDRIQALLRKNAIERDGECVLRQKETMLPSSYFDCGPRRKDGEIIVQAEHLVGRSNSQCYADMNNIVLLCQRHHHHFKQQHGSLYWRMIELIVGPERWEKIRAWEADKTAHRFYASDWIRIEGELSTNTNT